MKMNCLGITLVAKKNSILLLLFANGLPGDRAMLSTIEGSEKFRVEIVKQRFSDKLLH